LKAGFEKIQGNMRKEGIGQKVLFRLSDSLKFMSKAIERIRYQISRSAGDGLLTLQVSFEDLRPPGGRVLP